MPGMPMNMIATPSRSWMSRSISRAVGGNRSASSMMINSVARGVLEFFADLPGVDEVLVNANVEAFSVELDVLDQNSVLWLDLRGVEDGLKCPG